LLARIRGILSAEEVSECRKALAAAEWVDGRITAGHRFEHVKRNRQLPELHPTARRLGALILTALERNPLVLSAALPLKILPPLFNRYENGETYGDHVDGSIRPVTGTPHRIRTDVSATLFLSSPGEYEGGELVVSDTYGTHRVKLPAGDLILYPGSSLHRVEPVTHGVRLASFFWIESMVRDEARRTLLFELDTSIQELTAAIPESAAIDRLLNVYHNLLRQWADT
jgi:PKHD-type hydroxylase